MAITATTIATTIIKKYPTRLAIRCGSCGHQGSATVYLDKPPRLKCSKCKSRDAIICSRDRSATWSNQRRGK